MSNPMVESMFERDKLDWLLHALGDVEEPLGVFYSAEKPEGYGVEGAKHSCFMKYARLARVRRTAGWISRQHPGCRGAAIVAGYTEPSEALARYVSTGDAGQEGERYMPSPESMWRYYRDMDAAPAPADYCGVKPLSQFGEDRPLAVVFFVRNELLSGLCQLAFFAFDDHRAGDFPFGSGCASILSWPLLYARRGEDRAVVGGTDPSCRPYLETDELSFAVPAASFARMLDAAPRSFLTGTSWKAVQSKIAKSRRLWKR